MSTRVDRLLDLAQRIVSLERELAFLRSEFARLAGGEAASPSRRPGRGASLQVRVHAVLCGEPEFNFSAYAIAINISATVESVRAALSKLCASGRAVRVSTGLYQAIVVKPPESTQSDSRSDPRAAG